MDKTFVTTACVLLLVSSNSYAETVTATGTIETVDSTARTIKVLRKTAKGEKSGTFTVSPKADVLVAGKAADLASLTKGQSVTVTYDTTAKLVVKIETATSDPSPKAQVVDQTAMVRTFTGQKGAPGTLAFSPDGRRAASGGDKIVWCWDVSKGTQKWSYTELAPILNVRFSPDGKRIVACTKNRCVIYDADSGNDLAAFDIGQPLQAATISHDCRLLGVIYEKDHKAAVYSIERRRVIHKIAGGSYGPTIAFSRNNAKLVFGYAELHQFDLKTGKLKPNHIVQPTGSVIHGADFSPNNEFLATGSQQQYFPETKTNGMGDRMVRLWNVGSGQLVREFKGHREFIYPVAFTPDGKRLLSGGGGGGPPDSSDTSIRLWEVETGQVLHTFDSHKAPVISLAVSQDGRHFLSGGVDATMILWRLPD